MSEALPSHLVAIEDLDRGHVDAILARAEAIDAGRRFDCAPGPLVSLFFESSTRTRLSFESAANGLGLRVHHLDVARSSTSKGESLVDTIRTVDALRPGFLVLRHGSAGAAALAWRHTAASVVNAGDGSHEHPTQALLDAFTIRERFGRVEGLRVAIVGDVLHSRVARSNVRLLTMLGAEVVFVGPTFLVPAGLASLGARVAHDLDAELAHVDVLYLLRIQHERQRAGALPSPAAYLAHYGLTSERLARLRPDAVVMHPGPVNRGVEITDEALAAPRSLVQRQVEAGVLVRMAVLSLLPGRAGREAAA